MADATRQGRLFNDPALYRRMSQPKASIDAAQAAWDAFCAEVRVLREKHAIPDVLVASFIPCIEGDNETEVFANLNLGSSARSLELAARLYGSEQAIHEAMMRVMVSESKRIRRRSGGDE